MGGGGGGVSLPWRNERPNESEECWPDAKSYGRRLEVDGPANEGSPTGCEGPGWAGAAAANRCRRDETPGYDEGGRIAPCNSDEVRFASTSSLERDESESTRDCGGSSPPSQNKSIARRVAAKFSSNSCSVRSLVASL